MQSEARCIVSLLLVALALAPSAAVAQSNATEETQWNWYYLASPDTAASTDPQAETGSSGRLLKAVVSCPGATPSDIMGPYYTEGAPFKPTTRSICMPSNKTAPDAKPVKTIAMSGRVYDAQACAKGLNGTALSAVVEVWHADNAGDYDNDSFNCRSSLRVSATGAYSFRSIVPASYGPTSCLRPAHIHVRVRAAGYRTLVTQVYFKGDPYLGDKDCGCGFCQSGRQALQSGLRCTRNGTQCTNSFDIYLQKA